MVNPRDQIEHELREVFDREQISADITSPAETRRQGGTMNYEDLWRLMKIITSCLTSSGDSEADPIYVTQDKTRHSATVSCAASFHPQMCCCRPVN